MADTYNNLANLVTNALSSKGVKKRVDDAENKSFDQNKEAHQKSNEASASGDGRPAPSFKWSKQ